MALLARPTKSFQTLHDVDYTKVFSMIKNARAIMQPGDIRVETRCPVCGGAAWVLPEHHNDGQSCISHVRGRVLRVLGIETDYYVSRALDLNYAALALAVYGGGDIT